MRTHQPRMGLEVKAITVHPAGRRIANHMEVKNVTLTVDPIAQSRHAWEMRELNEIVVALAALE